jgi:predicted anti-sigma-YlaC factor YlaD
MNERSCRIITKMLVDYSDGELAEAEGQEVEVHLVDCPDCRSELRRLDRSLALAKETWSELAAEAAIVPRKSTAWAAEEGSVRSRHGRRRLAIAALTAACAAALLLMFNAQWFSSAHRDRQVAQPDAVQPTGRVTTQTAGSAPAKPFPDDTDIQTYIDRQARAARLAAAIELLATEPSLKEYQDEAQRYLARAYPDADLGKNSPQPPSGSGAASSSKEPKS